MPARLHLGDEPFGFPSLCRARLEHFRPEFLTLEDGRAYPWRATADTGPGKSGHRLLGGSGL